ncbi:MAG: hypothetical protein ABIQ88_22715 [Chitinophagaceae bacterium]
MQPGLVIFYITLRDTACSQQNIDLVISNPLIINVSNGTVLKNHDILIKGNLINAIVPHRKKYHSAILVADASNRYLIPGLRYMHMHFGGGGSLVAKNKALLPLFIANGITAVKDAAPDISMQVLQWRAVIASGTLLEPASFTSGSKLKGTNSIRAR